MSREDCVTNAAAYVLGALEPNEATSYRDHLKTCAACRQEVSALEAIADVLPLAAPQHPLPRGLRRSLLRTVHAESRHAKTTQRPRGFTGLVRWAIPLRPAAAVASVLVVIVVAIAVTSIVSGGSPGSRLIPATVVGATGTADLQISNGRGELIVRHFPAPPTGRIYEVWLKRPGGAPVPTSALFSVTNSGVADIGIPDELRGVSEVLVTQEPAGGSPTPTGPAVIVAPTS